MSLPSVAVVCDLLEENWPSMQLVGEMLVNHLGSGYSDAWSVASMCPPMRFRLARAPLVANVGFKLDRVVNRFWDYPRWVRPRRRGRGNHSNAGNCCEYSASCSGKCGCRPEVHSAQSISGGRCQRTRRPGGESR